jgi:hypothetical protein
MVSVGILVRSSPTWYDERRAHQSSLAVLLLIHDTHTCPVHLLLRSHRLRRRGVRVLGGLQQPRVLPLQRLRLLLRRRQQRPARVRRVLHHL